MTVTWSVVVRSFLCIVAAFANAFELGLQGNGTFVPSGAFLGFLLGLTWSVLVLFGLPSLARRFQPRTKVAIWAVSFLAWLAVFVLVLP